MFEVTGEVVESELGLIDDCWIGLCRVELELEVAIELELSGLNTELLLGVAAEDEVEPVEPAVWGFALLL